MTPGKRNEQTRESLLEQGLKAFLSCGYNGVGLKTILDEVNVPKGSFYNYFASKEDFTAEVITRYVASSAEKMDEVFSSSDDALTNFKQFFYKQITSQDETSCSQGCLIGNLGTEIGASSEKCRAIMAEAWHAVENRFADVIAQAQTQNTVRTDLPPDQLATVIFVAWQGALVRMKIDASTKPLQFFIETMIDDYLCQGKIAH